MSYDYIGAVDFKYPLRIISGPPPICGRAKKCLGGELVVVSVPNRRRTYQALTIDVAFEWVPSRDLRSLRTWWSYAVKMAFQADYISGICLIDPTKGLYKSEHVFGADIAQKAMANTKSDYFNGEIRLQVLEGYIWG